MSGSAGIYLEQAILGHTLGFAPMPAVTTVYVALCLAGPAAPPTEVVHGIEVTGLGYARVLAPFALAASHANLAANVSSVEYDDAGAAWGNIGYFELWDSPTGGNRLYWGQIIDPNTGVALAITVAAGDIVRFSSGALAVQAATGTATPTGTVGAYLPLAGGTLTGALTLAADPVAGTTGALQAATRQYVDAHSGTGGGAGFLPISGGSLTGALTLVGDAAASLQPVTLQQLNAANVAAGTTYLPLAGGTLTGALHAPWYHLTGNTASYGSQGLYLMWNRVGDGDAYFVNNRGLGGGGFVFQNTDGTTDLQLFSVTPGGATLAVPLTLPADPTPGSMQAATAHYVDAHAGGLPLTGGTISGNLGVSGAFSSNGGAGFSGGNVTFSNSPVGLNVINRLTIGSIVFNALPGNYINDSAAATGGVPIGGIYRNGGQLLVRQS